MIKTSALVVILITLLSSCTQQSSESSVTPNIQGVWSEVDYDTLYSELILTTDRTLVYDRWAGPVIRWYRMQNDTMYFGDFKNRMFPTFYYKRISDDEFTLRDLKTSRIGKFKRIAIPFDTAKIMNDDQAMLDYGISVSARRAKWQMDHGLEFTD